MNYIFKAGLSFLLIRLLNFKRFCQS